jgi:hypothetical protein
MSTGPGAAILCAIAIATVGSLLTAAEVRATTNARYTVEREIRFGVPDDRTRTVMRQVPDAREIAAGDFLFAAEDLDDDGTREVILLSRAPSLCLDGRCALIVLQRRPKSIETLLLQRVPSRLALTAEKTNGYRALAAVGANGGIAVGDRRDAALAGKPLVYLMRADPVARTASGPTPKSTGAAAASPAKAGSVRLEDIAAVLALPVGDNNAKIDWKAMEKLPGIRMGRTGDTERYSYRDSTLMLDSLGMADVKWTGISDFVVVAIVNTGKKIPPTQYTSMLQGQFSTAGPKQLRGGCSGAAFGKDSAIYEVNLPQRQPLYLRLDSEPRERSGNLTIVVSQENSPRWAC